jgi:hypothetical protein
MQTQMLPPIANPLICCSYTTACSAHRHQALCLKVRHWRKTSRFTSLTMSVWPCLSTSLYFSNSHFQCLIWEPHENQQRWVQRRLVTIHGWERSCCFQQECGGKFIAMLGAELKMPSKSAAGRQQMFCYTCPSCQLHLSCLWRPEQMHLWLCRFQFQRITLVVCVPVNLVQWSTSFFFFWEELKFRIGR